MQRRKRSFFFCACLEGHPFERVWRAARRSRSTCGPIAATNRDLEKDVAEGKFSPRPLFFGCTCWKLSCRHCGKRPEDIPVLAEYFFAAIRDRKRATKITGFTPRAMEELLRYTAGLEMSAR